MWEASLTRRRSCPGGRKVQEQPKHNGQTYDTSTSNRETGKKINTPTTDLYSYITAAMCRCTVWIVPLSTDTAASHTNTRLRSCCRQPNVKIQIRKSSIVWTNSARTEYCVLHPDELEAIAVHNNCLNHDISPSVPVFLLVDCSELTTTTANWCGGWPYHVMLEWQADPGSPKEIIRGRTNNTLHTLVALTAPSTHSVLCDVQFTLGGSEFRGCAQLFAVSVQDVQPWQRHNIGWR